MFRIIYCYPKPAPPSSPLRTLRLTHSCLFPSIIRQVPDNQEVYLDANGLTSIIFDITERVAHLATDEDALKYHFEDIVETGEGVRIWDSTTATFAKLPYVLLRLVLGPEIHRLRELVICFIPVKQPCNTLNCPDYVFLLLSLSLSLSLSSFCSILLKLGTIHHSH